MSGWYIMHRGWMDSFKPELFTEREAFLWSIEQAAFQDHDQWFNGHRFIVSRGEFVTSLRDMEKAFGWSLKRIRGFMDRMGKAQKWTQRRAYEGAQSPTIISVCNYDFYQSAIDDKGTVEGTAKGTRRAQSGHSKGTQQNKGNKGNKGKEEEIPDGISRQPAPDHVGEAFADYDAMRRQIVPSARSIELTPDRRQKLAARLVDLGGPEGWGKALATIRGSPFLRGETSRNGTLVATIDWLLEPKNLRKVMEGNYDDRGAEAGARKPPVSPRSADAIGAALAMSGLMPSTQGSNL